MFCCTTSLAPLDSRWDNSPHHPWCSALWVKEAQVKGEQVKGDEGGDAASGKIEARNSVVVDVGRTYIQSYVT